MENKQLATISNASELQEEFDNKLSKEDGIIITNEKGNKV